MASTNVALRRLGMYSVVRATVLGIAAPKAMPVRNRRIISSVTLVATSVTSVSNPNVTVLKRMSRRCSNASSVLLTVFSSNYLLLFSGASGSTGDRRIVSRRHEGICEEVAVGETSGRPEIASRMADHQWVAAGIDLPPRQIGQIPQHGVMDQAHSSVPIQIGLRQDRDELEPARARGPLPRQIGQVQIALTAATPIQVHRTFVATLDQIFDDRLQRDRKS